VFEYLKLQGRFGHLAVEHVSKIQASANRKWEQIGADVPAEFRDAKNPEWNRSRGIGEAGAAASEKATAW
jgi:hypothetical protein